MKPRSTALSAGSAMVAGGALSVAVEVGGSLLLYGGAGELRAGGALLAVALAALGAGYWAGRPDGTEKGAPPSTWKWFAAAASMVLAAAFAAWWLSSAHRQHAGWQALAVIVLLGVPAYAVGGLLAVLQLRREVEQRPVRGGVMVPALAGGALAAVVTALVVPRVGGVLTLFDCGLLLGLLGATESRAGSGPLTGAAGERTGERKGFMDNVVLVTGVGRRGQVGYAVARALLQAGAKVVVTNIHDSVRALAEDLGREVDAPDRIVARTADLTRGFEAGQLVELAQKTFGRLDAVVNVAGGLSVIKPVTDTSDEEWQREMERNAQTAFMVCREALPALRESHGAIVNFASPSGLRASPRLAAYSAAKAAVVALTRALAAEEAENGVRVNAIAPGMVDTEQNRRTMADADSVHWVTRPQIVAAVMFLLSDEASGISGETIQVLGSTVSDE